VRGPCPGYRQSEMFLRKEIRREGELQDVSKLFEEGEGPGSTIQPGWRFQASWTAVILKGGEKGTSYRGGTLGD